MTTLAATQQLLWTLITAPEGVAKALDAAAGCGEGSAPRGALAQTVRSDDRLSAVERLDVYANMYFYRLLDVLRDDFPALDGLVGRDAFHNLVTDYLLQHPPVHYSLRYAGASLPGFVGGHALAGEHPYLGDLAVFEWALVEAFDAPDSPILARADLQAVRPEQWPALRFRFQSALKLCRFRWAVHEVRRRVDDGEPADTPRQEEMCLCLWRQGFVVRYRPLAPLEGNALQLLVFGGTFGAACAAAAEASDDGTAAQRLAAGLAGWIDEGLLSAVHNE